MELPCRPSEEPWATVWASAVVALDVLERLERGEITREEAVALAEMALSTGHWALLEEMARVGGVAGGWRRAGGA